VQQNRDGVQKWFNLFGLFNFFLLLLTLSLSAKSFEEFQRVQNIQFQRYKDANDLEFSRYLKTPWEEYTTERSPNLYKKQKPKSITPSLEKHINSVGPRVQIARGKLSDTNLTLPSIIEKRDLNLLFFGQKVALDIDKNYLNAKFYPQNQVGITNFFNTIAASEYEETIATIEKLAQRYQLNDWGIYQLVQLISESIYTLPDERKLFSWFLFNKLGYAVKIGLASKHVVVMYWSKKTIYATPKFTFEGKEFYVINSYAQGFSESVFTYPQNYPNAEKPLDLSIKSLPRWKADIRTKLLTFKQFSKEYKIHYNYDANLIAFMATYPQADYETYFNAPMSPMAYDSIAKDIKKYIDGKKSSVAINFVLNFVQKAFLYERDQAQFNREKVMFAEETLFYEKSDCEDRAILFATLVKKLFAITVIGVKYKDHMATALYIPMKGDSVKAGLRRFVIADPTYVNANIGESMPKYRSKIPESFIVVKRDENE
jgi:hypothetical protein